MKIIFVGPQGSGKGTQAKIISEKLHIPHISIGDLMRGAKGELKSELDFYMNSGKLVPDELVVKILKERIKEEDCKNGFILDGFPRNLNQTKLLEKITMVDRVVEITLSDEEAIKRISGRLTCANCKASYNEFTAPIPKEKGICDLCKGILIKRADDNPEAVKKRLEIYHKETEPILKEYYKILIKVNGNSEIDKITNEILEKLGY